jgi:hypothetical protein
MDAKKVRNAGLISVLSLALALGAGLASSMSVGAQGQTDTGNDKPDPSQPIVRSISGKSIVVAITPDYNSEVPVDASTLVVKDGKFASMSALKVGDKVQVDPRITLPNGLEGHGTSSAAPQAPSQGDPSDPDKKLVDEGRTEEGSGQPDAPGGTALPNTPQNPEDPDKPATNSPDTGLLPGEGNGSATASTVSVIWVTSSNSDQLLGGVVHWAQGDTAVLSLPGVAYSEYVIHTTSSTGYQKMLSAGATPSAVNASDLSVGSSVIVLGVDGGSDNAGFFTAKAVLVLPASGKLR